MTRRKTTREELEALRSEFESLRNVAKEPEAPAPPNDEPTGNMIERQMTELNRMVQDMLDDAEQTVADHPKATVAGAIALGILIGRLTAK
ncbi:MAG: DUF883 C-terminal domain-containing protein [Rhizobiaceae bacterium]